MHHTSTRGFVLWFTGLSGSGKSTLTAMVAAELRRRGIHVETLDGDEVRKHLSKGLGFSREDRDANIRRIGFVAKLVARSGGCAIAAAISPYREVRSEIRAGIDRFCEVYTECPIDVLAERDPKGLYKKALAGEIKNFTGVDDPYQAPEAAEVHLHTDRENPDESLVRILGRLEELGFITAAKDARFEHARTADPWQGLLPPHGGDLSDRVLRGDLAGEARRRAAGAPSITLDDEALADLGAIGCGLYSPLNGFVTSKEHLRILDGMRLEAGLPWAAPLTLRVSEERQKDLAGADRVALKDASGTLVALLSVQDVWRPDRVHEAEALFGTTDPTHPGVAQLAARGPIAVGGDVACLAPASPATFGPLLGPHEVRLQLHHLGARRVSAFSASTAPDLEQEYVVRAALEESDACLTLVGWSATSDISASRKAEAWRALYAAYFAPGRGLVVTYPDPVMLEPARRQLHRAIVAQNLGAERLLVPEDAADLPHANEPPVHVVRVPHLGWSARLGHPASARTAPDATTPDDPRVRARRREVDAALGGTRA